jgi:hypothetical protein
LPGARLKTRGLQGTNRDAMHAGPNCRLVCESYLAKLALRRVLSSEAHDASSCRTLVSSLLTLDGSAHAGAYPARTTE